MAINYRTDYQRYRQYYVNLRRFYQKPTVKVSFFVLLSFAMVAFFTGLAIRPTITTIGSLIRDIEDKRQVSKQLDQKLQALDQVQGVVSALEAEEGLLQSALPQEAALGRLLQELEYSAAGQKVQLSAVHFGNVALGQTSTRKRLDAQVVPLNFTAIGSFSGVKAFLKATEELDRIVVVTDVQLGSGATGVQTAGGAVVAQVTGKVYYVPPAGGEK